MNGNHAEHKFAQPWTRAAIALAITAALLVALVLWRPAGLYAWLKAAHIVAVIAWMAGMLYLPRLFVYHAVAKPGSELSETFKVMERRLLRIIINPAMVGTWVLGMWLAIEGGWFRSGWFLSKFALVTVMSAVHGFFARWVREFADDANQHTDKFYRIINELPTILVILIVILAVVKPF
jgi:putative membrane protein